MRSFWHGKRVLVTGGAGFIGSHVVEALRRREVADEQIIIPRSRDCDLRLPENCRKVVRGCDLIIHLAAPTGGIAYTRAHPASQFRDCSLINLHMLDAASESGIDKFVALGNLFAYPAAAASPLREEDLHAGPVSAAHLGLGLVKREMVSLADMYHQEYGLNAINVLSANAYGPGDRFDPQASHVIPATIQKCFRDEDLVVWGDGSATRDFLYAEDIAEGILSAAEHLPAPQFVNLASGTEVSIADLVKLIASVSGFSRDIVFDHSKGGGEVRRSAAVSKAGELIGFSPRVPLEEGLKRTVDWYKKECLRSA